ncbi:MAG: XRE family transcriptional regulator [Spirochaetia bacterium]
MFKVVYYIERDCTCQMDGSVKYRSDKIERAPFQIGRNIQEIRRKLNMTLGHLSARSGVSKAMLSQIETDKVNPTVVTLWKIANGLNVDIDVLLKGSDDIEKKFNVSRKDDITTIDAEEGRVHIRVLSPFSMVEDLEMYMLTIDSGGKLESEPHFPQTEEFLSIIEGTVEVHAGANSTEITTGDFINYHCDVDHAIYNKSDEPAVLHMIVRFNKQG